MVKIKESPSHVTMMATGQREGMLETLVGPERLKVSAVLTLVVLRVRFLGLDYEDCLTCERKNLEK